MYLGQVVCKLCQIFLFCIAIIVCNNFLANSTAWTKPSCENTNHYASKCKGNVRQTHTRPPYRFVTTTRLYWKENANVHVYETCVENHSDRWLYINWLIPKQDGWIEPGCAWSKPRPKLKENTINSYEACLLYGNLKKDSYGTIIPHKDDQEAITKEGGKCPKKFAAKSPVFESDHSENEIVRDIVKWVSKTFVPTNPEKPDTTMVEIEAMTRLEFKRDDNVFVHRFSYYVTPLKNTKSLELHKINAQPQFAPLQKQYEQQFKLANGSFKLKQKGGFTTTLRMPKEPRLEEIGFALSTVEGQHLGTLYVPVWR